MIETEEQLKSDIRALGGTVEAAEPDSYHWAISGRYAGPAEYYRVKHPVGVPREQIICFPRGEWADNEARDEQWFEAIRNLSFFVDRLKKMRDHDVQMGYSDVKELWNYE